MLCCHQLCNHLGSFRILFQSMLPTLFDRRGAIFPFLWRTTLHESTVPSASSVRLRCHQLCNHFRLISSFVSSHIANAVRQAGRDLSIFVKDSALRVNSSFRHHCDVVLPSAVQPFRLTSIFVSIHVANAARQAGRYLPIFWRTTLHESTVPSASSVRLRCHQLCNHFRLISSFVSSHIANAVRQAGRYLSTFVKDSAL